MDNHNVLEESPFFDEVVVRDYAQQAGPGTDAVDYSPLEEQPTPSEPLPTTEERPDESKSAPKATTLQEDFVVDDDEDFLRMEALNEKAKAAYQDQDQEMRYEPSTEDTDAEVLSSEIHQGVVDQGKYALSEQIYSGLSTLVPEALHEFSKIKDATFLEQDWSEAIIRTTLTRVQEHNEQQRQKFAWGKMHESQIKYNLRAYLLERGLENTTSPAGMLLIGLVTVAIATFFIFKRVRKENKSMEARLLSEIEQLIRDGEGRRHA